MNFKEKIDAGLDGIDNIKEFMMNQPKKRCGLIEGHDNYWEGKIEAIKKVLDETLDTPRDSERALNEIKKILEK
uniref:Uncharacterized protein n=1 Tax=uncultured marine thaumarchaeote KM3_57_D03 TaxID=1456206 RepID=A0A075HC23_9ARCH|nr:hypothetical protein [uncultured marine thaumarchaeote KM3_57_D03]